MAAPRELVLAFLGDVVPNREEFHGPAFSRASQKFLGGLLHGLVRVGLDSIELHSIEPIPAFPRGRRLFGRRGTTVLASGLPVRFIPFINVKPLKVLTTGIVLCLQMVKWGWRHRGHERVICLVNLTMPPAAFVLVAARLIRAKAIVLLLDVYKPGHLVPNTWPWRADFWLNRKTIRWFDGHMVISPAIARDLVPGRRVCVVDGAVDADRFEAPEPHLRAGLRIVLAGSLQIHNGVDVVLGALPYLDASVELIVAGAGGREAAVRQAAQRDPRVKYVGLLEIEGLMALYRDADLLLNIRLTQAVDTRYFFPSKLMELFASGTPVLSTCTGHVEEEYGGVVYLLRDETSEGLARRIAEIGSCDPADRRAVGMRARDYVRREKTWDRQAAKLADYIHSVAAPM